MTNYNLQASREWWAQRWLELLDSYRFKKRLERARNYAREGNVLSIEFKGSKVLAKVQGTEPEPYQVSLSLDPFTDEQWGYVIETMSQRAIFAAKLLAGEMPQNIEQVFTANGLSLFPFTLSDIHSKCSCPDKANPCKHIGAIYYQLGDRFSEDPFVLFQLRGRTKDQIIVALRELRAASVDTPDPETPLDTSFRDELTPLKLAHASSTGVATTGGTPTPVRSPGNPALATGSATRSLLNGGNPSGSQSPTEGNPPAALSHPRTRLAPPHPLDIDQFWQYNEPLESTLVVIVPPPSSETVLDVLGPIPLPESDAHDTKVTDSEAVMHYLDTVYKAVSQQAVLSAMNMEGT